MCNLAAKPIWQSGASPNLVQSGNVPNLANLVWKSIWQSGRRANLAWTHKTNHIDELFAKKSRPKNSRPKFHRNSRMPDWAAEAILCQIGKKRKGARLEITKSSRQIDPDSKIKSSSLVFDYPVFLFQSIILHMLRKPWWYELQCAGHSGEP